MIYDENVEYLIVKPKPEQQERLAMVTRNCSRFMVGGSTI
jgi:hypothetical protein